jgi:hypothetical protein
MFNKVQLSHAGGVLAAMGLACLATWAASPVNAAVITTADGQGADAFVNGGDGKQNSKYGSQTFVAVYSRSGSTTVYKTYLRFDLSSLHGAQAASVVLQLTYDSAYADGSVNVYGLNNGTTGDADPTSTGWTESGITWSNAPANAAGLSDFTSDATFIMSAAKSGATDTFTSTALTDFVNADTNGFVTILFSGTGLGQSRDWYSKEGTTDRSQLPTLDITLAPEPASAGLLLLGGVGALWMRRRT